VNFDSVGDFGSGFGCVAQPVKNSENSPTKRPIWQYERIGAFIGVSPDSYEFRG
jgi:hypothetical protein